MSGNPFAGNPFAGAQPGAAQAAPKQVLTGFSLPADPTWEPMEFGDFLEQNGYYAARIVSEKATDSKFIMMFELLDADAAGKRVSGFFGDPGEDPKAINKWRGLMLSITGNKDAARVNVDYRPGLFTGQTVYFKTGSYAANNGDMRTGIDNFITAQEYQAHVAGGKHRWKAEVKAKPSLAGGPAGAFGLPAGLPPGVGVPMPPAAAPVQAPPTQAQQVVAGFNTGAQLGAPPPAPPQQFGFAPPAAPPAAPPPAPPAAIPPGVPQPGANPFAFPPVK